MPAAVVAPDWLARHLADPNVVVVDASWYLPSAQRDPRAEYLAAHLPGAVFWDLDAMSDPDTTLPHMLPDPASLGRWIGELGIGNDSRVVVYDGSGANLSAARVWWTLRVAGHDQVAVLDGGLSRWKSEGRPLVGGPVRRAAATFRVRWRPELVHSLETVRANLGAGEWQALDARSRGRFAGTEPEPRPGLRSGHMPGARNLPYAELVDSEGSIRPRTELVALFEAAGLDLSKPVVTSCGSGVTACALALGLHTIGHRNYAVYDGSWTEWSQQEGPPVVTGSD